MEVQQGTVGGMPVTVVPKKLAVAMKRKEEVKDSPPQLVLWEVAVQISLELTSLGRQGEQPEASGYDSLITQCDITASVANR